MCQLAFSPPPLPPQMPRTFNNLDQHVPDVNLREGDRVGEDPEEQESRSVAMMWILMLAEESGAVAFPEWGENVEPVATQGTLDVFIGEELSVRKFSIVRKRSLYAPVLHATGSTLRVFPTLHAPCATCKCRGHSLVAIPQAKHGWWRLSIHSKHQPTRACGCHSGTLELNGGSSLWCMEGEEMLSS